MPATVERAIKCLSLIEASESGSTLSELADQLSTSISSTSRLVQTLRNAGLVSRDETTGKLHPGLRLWELGSAALSRLTIRQFVIPLLVPAIPELGRPVNFTVPNGERVLFVDRLELLGGVVIAIPVGGHSEYHISAVGKAILAFSSDDFVRKIAERGFKRHSEKTITNLADLKREFLAIRDTGVAVTREERRPGAYGLGAPILNASGLAVAAIGIQVPEEQANPQSQLARQLSDLGRAVSLQLGYLYDVRNSLI